ncbi:MAG: hypothetical protein HYZ28_29040 [Myxococcales bacterium]|nr:hypothetical protein [Myxococcales bacterium]
MVRPTCSGRRTNSAANPDDADALLYVAECLSKLGDPSAATERVERVLRANPTNLDALEMRARVRWSAKDWHGCADDCRLILSIEPGNAWATGSLELALAKCREEGVLTAPPEVAGGALVEMLGHFAAFELNDLACELGLDARGPEARASAEWELAQWLSFCLLRSCTDLLPRENAEQVAAVFLREAASGEPLDRYLVTVQPVFDHYERTLGAIPGADAAQTMGHPAYWRMLPNATPQKKALQALSSLWSQKYLDAAALLGKLAGTAR